MCIRDSSIAVADIRESFKVATTDSHSLKAKSLTLFSQAPKISSKPPANQTRRQADRKKNIPHFTFLDENSGILQEVSFQREDMPGLREARLFEGSDFAGPGIIPEKYNATLNVVGTSAFKPGSIFYIDPKPLDMGYAKDFGSPARAMGLGGYYLVIRVTHNISYFDSANWDTRIDTQWQGFGEDDPLRVKKSGKCKITSIKARLATAVNLNDPSVIAALDKKEEDDAAKEAAAALAATPAVRAKQNISSATVDPASFEAWLLKQRTRNRSWSRASAVAKGGESWGELWDARYPSKP
jgi:hypothetical protein